MRLAVAAALSIVAGCAVPDPEADIPEVDTATYKDARVRYLSDDLLQVLVDIEGAPTPDGLRAVTDCQSAISLRRRDMSFARHVRTQLAEEGGILRADAVYTFAKERPRGDFVLDVDEQAETCEEPGASEADE